jgi:hypothetical protein
VEAFLLQNGAAAECHAVRCRRQRVRYILPRHKRGNWVGPGRVRKSTRPGASGVIELTPFEFLDRLAALIPPPRRHRYHGVFAPNHSLRQAVTAVAVGNLGKQEETKTDEHAGVLATAGGDCRGSTGTVDGKSCHHDTSRSAWAKLLARVGEAFPLACPSCGGDIRLISFITDPEPIRKILMHLGEPLEPPRVSLARGPPVDWAELVQSNRAGEFEQASPDDLPMNDIHHR